MNFYLTKQYIKHQILACNSKGHGVHSPFVYKLIRDVLMNKHVPLIFDQIEDYRAVLKFDKSIIEVVDYGAGSKSLSGNFRKISNIASSSLSRRKYAQLLHNLVKYCEAENILELGTSLGITTCYLATANNKATVHTIEACPKILEIAVDIFKNLNISNIKYHKGRFNDKMPEVLNDMSVVEFAFIDGNHSKEATLYHFNKILPYTTDNSILVFDDIYWSKEMTEAWESIKQNDAVCTTIDIFQFGIVFLNQNLKKQNFRIRF